MDEQTDFIQGITKYIQGQLTETGAMDLWVGLLTYPEWICYLEIELALNELYQTMPAPLRTQPQHWMLPQPVIPQKRAAMQHNTPI